MTKASISLSWKATLARKINAIKSITKFFDVEASLDHAYNLTISGETEKVREAFKCIKVYGYAKRMSELPFANGESLGILFK